jgi:SAM-dependent methyltransferase
MKISYCRSCKKNKLEKIFKLGKQYFTGIFPLKKNDIVPKGNLSLVKCKNCDLLQLEDDFNQNIMYGANYGYMSSLNKSMEFHLKRKALNLIKRYKLVSQNNILDIGSNDGTFLRNFTSKFKLYGCDPTIKKFKKYYRKDIITVPDFFSKNIFKENTFDLITTISMFYDLPDPREFSNNIYRVLKKNGIWHIELSYMPTMIKNTSYDTICHEHLEYYSLKSLKFLLDSLNCKIINIAFNQINGGSIELDVAKKESRYKENKKLIQWILEREQIGKYNTTRRLKLFFDECEKHKLLLKKLLNSLRADKKKILGYGASTKGNVILQYCKLSDKQIPYIAEVNNFKFNKHTPGTKIKIISEKQAMKYKPDYFLVLPWHFKEHIIKREKKFLSNGGKLIFPLPEIEIV